MGEFSIASELSAAPERVWRHSVTPAELNREFRPLFRMTFPTEIEDVTTPFRAGERLCRSWLLLGGILPVEYDDVVFVELERGRRFLERSSMLTQRVWEHERTVEPTPWGCRLTDRVRFVPRVAWLELLQGAVFRRFFRMRHRKLRRLFGEAADSR